MTAWFERTFYFSFPVDQLPDICARLRSTTDRLEVVLRGRTLQTLVRKPDGKWSAQENAGHMLDLEPLWIVRIADYVNGSAELTEADLTNRKTDEANHNTTPTYDIVVGFRTAREQLLKCVERVNPSLFARAIPHPRLKMPMRLVDHLYFVAEHDDHHLKRIWELVKEEKFSG
jgi:DinB superfamily